MCAVDMNIWAPLQTMLQPSLIAKEQLDGHVNVKCFTTTWRANICIRAAFPFKPLFPGSDSMAISLPQVNWVTGLDIHLDSSFKLRPSWEEYTPIISRTIRSVVICIRSSFLKYCVEVWLYSIGNRGIKNIKEVATRTMLLSTND